MGITIAGLGPGAWGQVTLDVHAALEQAQELYLRTGRHPAVAHLPGHLTVHSFDDLSARAGSLEGARRAIVEQVWTLGQQPQGVLYGVPGHPLVGEATVRELLARGRDSGLPCRVLSGLSFVEPALVALEVDALEAGLQVVDALHPRVEPDRPALLARVEHRRLAAAVKRALLEVYPPAHRVTVVQGAGTPQERTHAIAVAALDDWPDWDGLTCLYVPALGLDDNVATLEGVRRIVERLRAPGGCPWDREQTHESLKPYLLEEAYEALHALDEGDMAKLAEELGDLLMNVLIQAQIAAESGEFTVHDMCRAVGEKLIRRHPHVFGTAHARTAQEVLANWELLKAQERRAEESALAGIPHAMPALAYSRTMLAKAGRLGVHLEAVAGANPAHPLRAALEQCPPPERLRRLGETLLGLVDLSERLALDPEEALRLANGRFRRRFMALEAAARQEGREIADLPPPTIRDLWQSQE
ncbi:MAG: nucleoside triphosphate pyrophosphohydrolase [Chloroflexi bacterium]|nr:nucleoside triphosphate pyrophosphohydrolase [Chloroflexota bacterium]